MPASGTFLPAPVHLLMRKKSSVPAYFVCCKHTHQDLLGCVDKINEPAGSEGLHNASTHDI